MTRVMNITNVGGVAFNVAGADADLTWGSDTIAAAVEFNAGLHSGAGGISFGAVAVEGRFVNVSPPQGVTVGIAILSGGLAVNTTALTGTAITSVGTVTFASITSSSTGDYMCFNTSTSEVTQSTTCTLSSERYKENIESMRDMGLDTVLSMRPVTFTSKIHPEAGPMPGFIAEEVERVDKRLVWYENGLVNSVKYLEYTAVLTRAIQQQQTEISDLKQRIAQLERR